MVDYQGHLCLQSRRYATASTPWVKTRTRSQWMAAMLSYEGSRTKTQVINLRAPSPRYSSAERSGVLVLGGEFRAAQFAAGIRPILRRPLGQEEETGHGKRGKDHHCDIHRAGIMLAGEANQRGNGSTEDELKNA